MTSPFARDNEYYAALDAVRGIAAIAIVFFHIGHWLNVPWLAPNSYLAVDLFYSLSGFVLASAYQTQKGLSVWQFAVRRYARLTPIIVLSLVISSSFIILRYYAADTRSHVSNETLSYISLITAFVLGTLNLPYFDAPHIIGGPELFPLNGPQYTLFFEVFVNILWWLTRHYHPIKFGALIVATCVPFSLYLGFGGANAENFISGFPRVIACFYLGVIVFHCRSSVAERLRLPANETVSCTAFLVLLSLLAILFNSNWQIGNLTHLIFNVIFVPLLLFFGSGVQLGEFYARASLSLGALSFPIYALHYPIFMWVNGIYRQRFGDQSALYEGPILLMAVIVASYLAVRYFDTPLRSRIAKALSVRRSPGLAQTT